MGFADEGSAPTHHGERSMVHIGLASLPSCEVPVLVEGEFVNCMSRVSEHGTAKVQWSTDLTMMDESKLYVYLCPYGGR
jgi:hypothetical protein